MSMSEAILTTDLPLPNKRQGKVRDLYDINLPNGEAGILIIASDRVSVFDVVLQNGIPGKGQMLTKISTFWFEFFNGRYKHHLVSTDPADIEGLTEAQRAELEGRIMICRRSEVVPVECIVRGYLTGSGFKIENGKISGSGNLNIAGKSRTIPLSLDLTSWSSGSYNILGTVKFKMSEFGIEPPTAMFGTISTGDDVTIVFNFVVKS